MTELSHRTIRDLIAAVQLEDVRLKESGAKTRVRDLTTVKNPTISMSHGAKVIQRFEDGFIVGAQLTARVDSGDAANPATDAPVQIMVAFALAYRLSDAPTYSDAVLDEFAQTNAVFNAWPYWREYVQTTSARMNLPPMILPVFRVTATPGQNPKPGSEKPAEAQRRRAKRGAQSKRPKR